MTFNSFNLRVFLKESIYKKDGKKYSPNNALFLRIDNIDKIYSNETKPEIQDKMTVEQYITKLLNNSNGHFISIGNTIIEKDNIKSIIIEPIE